MGPFIVFEGVEGSGKSTQTRALKKRLDRLGVPAILIKEPGGTALGQVTRRLLKHRVEIELDPLAELFLFAVARTQLVREVVRPALEKGEVVVCDRYAGSTLAYQGYGRGLDLKTIKTVNDIATRGLCPDLIILLDLDINEGLCRKGPKTIDDRFEREDVLFHSRVRHGYLEMANADAGRWLVIDASRAKREIGELIWGKVQQFLSQG